MICHGCPTPKWCSTNHCIGQAEEDLAGDKPDPTSQAPAAPSSEGEGGSLAETEMALVNWEQEDSWPGNDAHLHFEAFDRWDWCDIAEEGRRIYGLMIDDEIEQESPTDAIICGVAAAASHGAFSAMAAALGLNARALETVIAEWQEQQDNPPQPVTFGRLVEMCDEWEKEKSAMSVQQ